MPIRARPMRSMSFSTPFFPHADVQTAVTFAVLQFTQEKGIFLGMGTVPNETLQ
jgi:hypothetical protein